VKPWLWLRVASVVDAVFTIGHTFGHFQTLKGKVGGPSVIAAMKNFHFNAMGSIRTYWDLLIGYSLFVIVTALLLTIVLWLLSNLGKAHVPHLRPVVWTLAAAHLLFAILCYRYFFIGPTLGNSVATVCLAMAAFSL
jgi:hypothetical protein